MSVQRITRKDGSVRFLARVRIDGRHRGAAFETKSAAKDWEAETISARKDNRYIPPESGRTTLAEHSELWLAHLHLRPTTLALYRSHLHARILPVLGDMPIGKIKRPHVQRFVAGLDLAPATVRTCYAVLAMIMKDTVESQLILTTPCHNISLPQKQPRPVEPMEPAAITALAESDDPAIRDRRLAGKLRRLASRRGAGLDRRSGPLPGTQDHRRSPVAGRAAGRAQDAQQQAGDPDRCLSY